MFVNCLPMFDSFKPSDTEAVILVNIGNAHRRDSTAR
jgi:hypothetical protein